MINGDFSVCNKCHNTFWFDLILLKCVNVWNISALWEYISYYKKSDNPSKCYSSAEMWRHQVLILVNYGLNSAINGILHWLQLI